MAPPPSVVADRAARLLHRRADSSRPSATRAASGVWVDELSARLLGDRFIMQFRGPDVLLLGQAKEEDTERPLLGKPTSCVGRDAELTMLETQLTNCINEVGADRRSADRSPGSASRACATNSCGAPSSVRSASRPSGPRRHDERRRSVGILAHALRQLCEVNSGAPARAAERPAKAPCSTYPRAGRRALAFLGELCGVPFDDVAVSGVHAARLDPQIMRESIQRAFLDWLAAGCRQRLCCLSSTICSGRTRSP